MKQKEEFKELNFIGPDTVKDAHQGNMEGIVSLLEEVREYLNEKDKSLDEINAKLDKWIDELGNHRKTT